MRTRVRARFQEEDNVNQAGWMYADLFLALMVIFLATISFVPQDSNPKSDSGKTNQNYYSGSTYNYDVGFTYLLGQTDFQPLKSEISKFLTDKKLPKNSNIIFIQLVGGYDPNTEKPSDGVTTAVKYALALVASDANFFGNASRSLDTSSTVPTGKALLRITFGPKVK